MPYDTTDLEQWEGSVDKITFRNEESGFAVIRLRNDQKEEIVAVGTLASVQQGEQLCCWGKWKIDKRYGKQLDVQWFESRMPTTISGLESYLGSGLIRGIGKRMAKRIVDYFGAKTLDILDHNPERLAEISGIGKKSVEGIKNSWKQQHSTRRVMIWLQNYGVSPAYAQRIYREYGEGSIEQIEENPYRLANEIIGIGFKIADSIAQRMGIAEDAPVRVASAIEYYLQQQHSEGHTCYPLATLIERVMQDLNVPENVVQDQLAFLSSQKRVLVQSMLQGEVLVLMVWNWLYYQMEQRIATKLEQLLLSATTAEDPTESDLDPIRAIAQTIPIQLETQQERAVWRSAFLPVHILTGGPGTGKSTIIKTLTRYLESLGMSYRLAAPTGRAAKRLAEITQRDAVTVHSLLGYTAMQTTAAMLHSTSAQLSGDVLIVDEASMLDTGLMSGIAKALGGQMRLVLVGDIDQLPSVGPGNVLRDLIASQRVPVTRLTEIFRQAQSSQIITNAHKINRGEMLDTRIQKNSDFFFIGEEEPEKIQQTLLSLLSGRLQKSYGWDMLRDVQVLSPMNKGELGTIRLNELIQQTLNPVGNGKAQVERGKTLFIEGDKVLQTRNNYDKGVYNGDIGIIESLDAEERTLRVRMDNDQLVEYSSEDWIELELAYAISVHKYQGSECPCIVIPLHTTHYRLLSRNLLYTAVTRGKKLVVLVGQERALQQAIRNHQENNRYTGLYQAMTQQQSGFPPIVVLEMPEPMFAGS